MKITYLVFNLDGMGGTSRSAITQANALAPDHDVRLLSVTRSADAAYYDLDPRLQVEHLVDVRDKKAPAYADVPAATAKALHARESALVPARWDQQFTALTDVALEERMPHLETDVLVTVTPGLLVAAVRLLPERVVVVHQEHRSSSDRTSGLEPLLAFAPQADVLALLTPTIEAWLRDELGALAPHTVVVPNPLPLGFAPRSRLDAPLIMTAGRLVPEKQFPKLVDAFGQVADRLPGWRLRICGTGPQRHDLLRQTQKWDLWDRVELPGNVPDMAAEWPKASIAALTSRAEGFPLVVQEAMAAGVPVASFDSPSGPREIIEHEVNGLLVSPAVGLAGWLPGPPSAVPVMRSCGSAWAEGALPGPHAQYDAHAIAERWTVQIFGDARARRAGLEDALTGRSRCAAAAAEWRRPDSPGSTSPQVTPARARHDALSTGGRLRAARASGDGWLVVPAHGDPHTQCW